MPTFTYPFSASFGAAKSGQAANVGYKVVSADGTVRIARTTAGVTERADAAGNATTGTYLAAPTLDTAWGYVRVIWDVAGLAGVAAEETINTGQALLDVAVSSRNAVAPDNATIANIYAAVDTEEGTILANVAAIKAKTDNLPASPAAVGSAMTLNLTQAVPTSNVAHTVGDALNAARAEGFGAWRLVGTALTLYAADGTTVVRTFTLDSATNPTARS